MCHIQVRLFVTYRLAGEAVDRQDLIARIRAGQAIVLEVRPAEEYEAAHIAGLSRCR
jgi:rhodanese-related sulfurtransferase